MLSVLRDATRSTQEQDSTTSPPLKNNPLGGKSMTLGGICFPPEFDPCTPVGNPVLMPTVSTQKGDGGGEGRLGRGGELGFPRYFIPRVPTPKPSLRAVYDLELTIPAVSA